MTCGKRTWVIDVIDCLIWEVKKVKNVQAVLKIATTSKETALYKDKRLGLTYLGSDHVLNIGSDGDIRRAYLLPMKTVAESTHNGEDDAAGWIRYNASKPRKDDEKFLWECPQIGVWKSENYYSAPLRDAR